MAIRFAGTAGAAPGTANAHCMEDALRLILATLFVWAGIAKLVTLRRFTMTLGQHGVPRPVRTPVAVVLGVLEIGVGAWLASGAATRGAGIAAAVLGGLFTAALLRVRLSGSRTATCGCFGGTRPAGTVLLTLRSALITAAGVAVAVGLPGIAGPPAETVRSAALAVLGVLVIGLSLAVVALYRQVGVLSLRIAPQSALELLEEGPATGELAPTLVDLRREGEELVAFVSLNCRVCIDVLPGLRAIDRDGIPVHWIREDQEEDVFADWGVPGTPYVVYLVDGVVRSKGLVNTLEQIQWVIDAGTERAKHAA